MTVRVGLIAEGAGEMAGLLTIPPAPGSALVDDQRGPAHALFGRAIAHTWKVPVAAVQFEAPLWTGRGTVARGAELLDRGTLRRILSWARPTQRPDLAVILVDADGTSDRRTRLVDFTDDLPGRRVFSVAVREFEAWLLADGATLREVLDRELAVSSPERLHPGAAKLRLNERCDASGRPQGAPPRGEAQALRARIARRDRARLPIVRCLPRRPPRRALTASDSGLALDDGCEREIGLVSRLRASLTPAT